MKMRKDVTSVMNRGKYERAGGSFFSIRKGSRILSTTWAYNEEHLEAHLKKDRVSYTSFQKLS